MNWYEHHIKDYAAAVMYHSWDEDMAYTRLLRWYYRKEKPLPLDVAEVCRKIGARTPEQRAAVDTILRDFFEQREDGWHNDKCDETISAYRAGQPEREAKKRNEDTRLERHRRERAELFAVLNGAGEHLPYNVPIADLRAAVERLRVSGRVSGASAAVPTFPNGATAPATPATPPATGTATLATATQPPPTITHPPELIGSGGAALAPAGAKPTRKRKPEEPGPTVATWTAYAGAYRHRYGADPVRNASVNGVLAQFVARLGAQEAPLVAAYYLTVEDNLLYVRAGHSVNTMLRDAEKLRTEWATGRRPPSAPATDRQRRMQQATTALRRPLQSGPETIDAEVRDVAAIGTR